ncbi:serrate RNA effector molecule homolog [Watersipora subatra]|uniref:serrate RNA effector molecule homolog n=1 Tax=Watersipora subatra TaxID=2589382 RepID=UPI00355B2DDE
MNEVFSRLKVEHKNKEGSSKEQVAEGTQREDTAKAVESGSQTEEDEQEIAQLKVDMVEVSSGMRIEQENEEKNSKKQVAGRIQREDTQSVAESVRQTDANENETVHLNFDMNEVLSGIRIEQESEEGNSKEQVVKVTEKEDAENVVGSGRQTEKHEDETVQLKFDMVEIFSEMGIEQKSEERNSEKHVAGGIQREDTQSIAESVRQTEASENETVRLNLDRNKSFLRDKNRTGKRG